MSVPQSRLAQAVARYRRDVARGESAAMAAIHAAYEDARPRVLAEIERVLDAIETRGEVTQGQAIRLAQLERLTEVIEDDLGAMGRRTEPFISRAQAQAIDAAIQGTSGMAEARAGNEADAVAIARNWVDVPREQLEHLIGSVSDGSPLRESLEKLGPGTADGMRSTLADGIVRSIPTRDIGRQLEAAFNISEARAQTIARTSIQQAARSAQLAQMAENDDILDGWEWFSALDDRTCLSCVANHGRRFPLSEQHFPSHPNCRCTAVPYLADYADQDIGPTGEEWFDSLPPDQQDRMLPIWARDEYRAGNLRIRDFAQEHNEPNYGRSYRQATREQALASAARRGQTSGGADLEWPGDSKLEFGDPGEPADLTQAKEHWGKRGVTLDDHVNPNYATLEVVDEGLRVAENVGAPLPQSIRFVEEPSVSAAAWVPSSATKTIVINTAREWVWGEPAIRTREQYEKGVSASPERAYPLLHELAHVHHASTFRSPAAWKAALEAQRGAGVDRKLHGLIEREVSAYATREPFEFIAEVYSGTLLGGSYSHEVYVYYEELGGPEIPRRRS